mmetsp:Transcript_76178/g.166243  ORF Transcript_76178/g.166243 Transcript_76178/m.166243 type:complete len:219 (-) Transcript_76178:629-1285(-)
MMRKMRRKTRRRSKLCSLRFRRLRRNRRPPPPPPSPSPSPSASSFFSSSSHCRPGPCCPRICHSPSCRRPRHPPSLSFSSSLALLRPLLVRPPLSLQQLFPLQLLQQRQQQQQPPTPPPPPFPPRAPSAAPSAKSTSMSMAGSLGRGGRPVGRTTPKFLQAQWPLPHYCCWSEKFETRRRCCRGCRWPLRHPRSWEGRQAEPADHQHGARKRHGLWMS